MKIEKNPSAVTEISCHDCQ